MECLHRLGCSENDDDRAAYKPMVEALLSHPGLDLKVRALPHGFLQQNIIATGLPNNHTKEVLGILAEKRGITLLQLLEEAAPMGGKQTPTCLHIVVEKASWSKDYRKVGLLLELGVTIDAKTKEFLGSDDPHDEVAQVRKKCGGKAAAKRVLQMMEQRDADPAGWKYVDDDPAGEDAPPMKRRNRGPRQFYK